MAIHHIYLDSNAAGGGDGSKSTPFNTLAGISTVSAASGDIRYVHVKSGSQFLGEQLAGVTSTVGRGFWIDVYGGSVRPIIDSTTSAPSWTLDGTHGFYKATALGTNVFGDVASRYTIGCLFEDGVAMTMQLYDSDLAAMSTALTGGGFACDWLTGDVYMKPTSGVAGDHTYRASTLHYNNWASQAGPYAVPDIEALAQAGRRVPDTPDGREWNFFYEGLRFIGGKFGAIALDRGLARINDCEFYGHGGVQREAYSIPHSGNSSHMGNGIGIVNAARGVIVENCLIEQCFDSGISPQTFTTNDVVSDVIIRNNTIRACGFYGIEISTHSSGVTVKNVLVEGNHISRPQDCFGYPIHVNRFRGIAIIETGTTNVMDNIVVRNNIVEDLEDTFGSGGGATAYVSTEGTGIVFSGNLARGCERHGFYLAVATGRTDTDIAIKRNIVDDCGGAGILLSGSVTTAQIDCFRNKFTNCAVGFQDTSSVNTPINFTHCQLDGTDAVDASRTTNITSSGGNTSTGTKTGYEYLFD